MNLEIISTALAKYGLKEAPGAADNPEILQMAKDAGFPEYIHDSIAWCSLFANWVAWKLGYESSKALNARSWLAIGEEVADPEQGDIVVLWRDDPKGDLGHVGFFINWDNSGVVYLVAGNQSNQVNVEAFSKTRILGVRRLRKLP